MVIPIMLSNAGYHHCSCLNNPDSEYYHQPATRVVVSLLEADSLDVKLNYLDGDYLAIFS